MNINYGLLPDIDAPGQDADGKRLKGKDKGRAKKRAMSVRALADIDRLALFDAGPGGVTLQVMPKTSLLMFFASDISLIP